jgi:hypothetical protein
VKNLVSLEMLSVNRDNQIVDNLTFFEKVLTFWINLVRIRKIMCAMMVHRIVIAGEFLAFELVFAVLPTSS